MWQNELQPRYDAIVAKHGKLARGNHANHLGTLCTGNHFIEMCLDEADTVWFMHHSGSRGVGKGPPEGSGGPVKVVSPFRCTRVSRVQRDFAKLRHFPPTTSI